MGTIFLWGQFGSISEFKMHKPFDIPFLYPGSYSHFAICLLIHILTLHIRDLQILIISIISKYDKIKLKYFS